MVPSAVSGKSPNLEARYSDSPIFLGSAFQFVLGMEVQRWRCTVCGYIYDPAVGDPGNGIAPGVSFEDLPGDWVCPVCGASKDMFERI